MPRKGKRPTALLAIPHANLTELAGEVVPQKRKCRIERQKARRLVRSKQVDRRPLNMQRHDALNEARQFRPIAFVNLLFAHKKLAAVRKQAEHIARIQERP